MPAGPLVAPGLPVPPGSGWPEDPATQATPVAADAAQVRTLAAGAAQAGRLDELTARQSVCRACPRLVEWREQVAAVKRASSRTQQYWGRPVPVPTSTAAGDGQRLIGTRMVAAVRCAPPVNKPSVTERDTCAPWLAAEFALVAHSVRVIVCLGGFAWQAAWPMLRSAGFAVPRPRPRFGHGSEVMLAAPAGPAPPAVSAAPAGTGSQVLLLGCYHPSQQNTFTGRVTPAMLDKVFGRASRAAA